HIDDVQLRSAHRFQNSDFPGPLHHGGINRLKNHKESDGDADSDYYADKWSESGQVTRRHHAQIILRRQNGVGFHPRLTLYLFHNLVSMCRTIELEIKHR